MTDEPVLSVIIPMYNAEKYIVDCIDSLILQPESCHLQIICIDDGSSDMTYEKCKAISTEFNNIQVYSLPHMGVSHARNVGITYSRAKYVAFLDADDCWRPNFFDSTIISMFERENDIYAFGWEILSEDSANNQCFPVQERIIPGGFNAVETGIRHFCAYFYRRFMLNNHRIFFPDGIQFNEDEIFKMKALFYAKDISFIPRVLFSNRLHKHSLRSGRYSAIGREQLIKAWGDAITYFQAEGTYSPIMCTYCQSIIIKLLDKMNRESRLDNRMLFLSKQYLHDRDFDYFSRILEDSNWHEHMWKRNGILVYCSSNDTDLYNPNWEKHFNTTRIPITSTVFPSADVYIIHLSFSEMFLSKNMYLLDNVLINLKDYAKQEALILVDLVLMPRDNDSSYVFAKKLLTQKHISGCCISDFSKIQIYSNHLRDNDRARQLYSALFPGEIISKVFQEE